MNIFKNKNKYESVCIVSKFLSPLATALFYISIITILLLVIISAIVFFVNVDVEKMLLPPFMKQVAVKEGVASFSIDLGVGFKIITPKENVSLNDIKAVIYAFILFLITSLAMLAPVFRFLSRLFKNVAEKNLFSEENAKVINFVGLIVILGNIVIGLVSQFYIYTLTSTFLTPESGQISISFGFDWNSLIIGGFIILLGSIYGCACETYRKKFSETTAVAEKKNL
ncbi:MAG: hypothetical protein A2Y17_10440 [Clostridiales bacterium GWF2_38_85]|nr:MAG: hypothetical protein A2Y17_10440 [Clostridiales bacterium GWF2_38_85]HBL84844.1 hypothetical protein [Clostridiales bacterium]